jgi:hypothetical protein
MAQPKNKRLSAAAKKAKPKNRYQTGGLIDEEALKRALGASREAESAIQSRVQQFQTQPSVRSAGGVAGEMGRGAASALAGGLDVVGGTAYNVLTAPGKVAGEFLRGVSGDTGSAIPRRATPAASKPATAAPKATPTAPAAPTRETGRPATRATTAMQPMTDWQRNYETGGAAPAAAAPNAAQMLMSGQGQEQNFGGPLASDRYARATAIRRSMREGDEGDLQSELVKRGRALLSESESSDTSIGGMFKSAVKAQQGRRLLEQATKLREQDLGMQREELQQSGEDRRTQTRESGADRRAAASILGDLQKAETTAQYNAALKKMEGEIARGNKEFEAYLKEGMPSTQAGIARDVATARKTEAEGSRAALAAQLEEIISNPSSPAADVAFAQSVLPQLTGRFTPAEQEQAKMLGRIGTPQFATPEASAAAQELLRRQTLGYAEGGAVNRMQPPAAPTMGMPNIQPQVQLVNDYRAYSAAATKLGATPVPFDQFASMKQARSMQGYAMGGAVQPMGQPMMPDVSMGYKDGGAIPVAGKQVLGPGDGKSDSIPAIIDGKTKAALSTGEFVFPIEAVQHYGLDRLNKMVEKARTSPSA